MIWPTTDVTPYMVYCDMELVPGHGRSLYRTQFQHFPMTNVMEVKTMSLQCIFFSVANVMEVKTMSQFSFFSSKCYGS